MKSALITGGSRGIGKAICIQLAKDSGYHIIINYHANKAAAVETLELVKANGASGEILQFDVADIMDVKEKLDIWQEKNKDGIIEVIVNMINNTIKTQEIVSRCTQWSILEFESFV